MIDSYIWKMISENGKRFRIPTEVSKKIVGTQSIWHRKTFPYHITASIFIINLKKTKTLLLKHRALDVWLQPGGHLEKGEYPIDAALREAKEETGISIDVKDTLESPLGSGAPSSIGIHSIPANSHKEEPAHHHVDFRYIGFSDAAFEIDRAESIAADWCDVGAIEPMDKRIFDTIFQ